MFLNGKRVKLNGVCEHHDLGALGAAFNKAALRRRFSILKEMGVNAIRTAHNPPAREFMDLADEMGFLVVSRPLTCGNCQRPNMTTLAFSTSGLKETCAVGCGGIAIIPPS